MNRNLSQCSYQPVPLEDYSPYLTTRAVELYGTVLNDLPRRRARPSRGSLGFSARSTAETVVKIIVHEDNKGRWLRGCPMLADAVHVLVRVNGTAGPKIWATKRDLLSEWGDLDPTHTIGIAPKHDERFAYLELADKHNLDKVVELITRCIDI